jgi:hypothetical protein
MKPKHLGSIAYTVLAFFVLWSIGLFVRDGVGLPGLLTPIGHLTDGLYVSDPATFAMAAKDIAEHGWLSANNEWIFHLWPPGFIFLEATVLKVFGDGVLLIPVLQIVSCAFLAVTLSFQRDFLREFVGDSLACIAPFLMFLFPVARIFLVEPFGLIFGETFSVSCYICATFLVVRSIKTENAAWACAAGICLAAAAYFRSQYESLLLASTAVAVPLVAWQIAKYVRGSKHNRYTSKLTIKSVVVCLVMAHVLMLPWRLHNWRVSGSFGWVETMNLVIRNSLSSEKTLHAAGGDFVIRGGGDLACRLEPSYCDKTDRSLFWKAFFRHMPEWYRIKASLLPDYWGASVKDASKPDHKPDSMDHFLNVLLLACIVSIAPLLIGARKHPYLPVILWSNVSTAAGLFIIYSLVQFEIRYFYLLKVYGVVMLLTLGAMAWRARPRSKLDEAMPSPGILANVGKNAEQ